MQVFCNAASRRTRQTRGEIAASARSAAGSAAISAATPSPERGSIQSGANPELLRQQDMATTRARQADERRFARAELAVMLNMMRPSYRAEIEDHAAEIEEATARPRDAFERERGEPEPS